MEKNSGTWLRLDGGVYREDIPMVYETAEGLVQCDLDKGLISEADAVYTRNQTLGVMGMDEYEGPQGPVGDGDLEVILRELLDCVAGTDVLKEDSMVYRDLLDMKLMNCLMPGSGEVMKEFWRHYEKSPEKTTDQYYGFGQDSDYIRRCRIAGDMKWTTDTRYGTLDITVDLSEPEEDPEAIAAVKLARQNGCPKCQLCMENVGYAGRTNHSTRNNHRTIPITISGGQWGLQYSPCMYYNEHYIVFNEQHVPMKVGRTVLRKLLSFVKQSPRYFLGFGAGLPIVGRFILSHDHFQGGHYTFVVAGAPIEKHFSIKGYEDVETGIVLWPVSVPRLRAVDPNRLIELGGVVLKAWREYTDEDASIFAETDGEPHDTITPIARKVGDTFELDLVLRNNITTEGFPLGVYHPHQELYHIRKESISLIEVIGLAVLPSRLETELAMLGEYMVDGKDI